MMKWLFLFLILLMGCGKPKDGANGLNGAPGSEGPQGVPGISGTDVTVVQLCKDYDTKYPTSFPEQALCINKVLFGVYWNNKQAFLAELPPGRYESTSPQGCSFTISDNCTVTP